MTLSGIVLRGLRVAVPFAAIVAAVMAGRWVVEALGMPEVPLSDAAMRRLLVIALVIYALVLALPFVPGAEIGLTLIAVYGTGVAPFVYLATLAGLMLAFGAGRLVPPARSAAALRRMRLGRMADLVASAGTEPLEARIAALVARTERRWVVALARHRHAVLALALFLPGNAVFGGGGGLALLAGLSRAITPPAFLATAAVAVLPVPLVLFVTGHLL